MTDTQKGGLKFGLALLGGAAIGAGLALLFAPRPGKETREIVGKWLKKKTEDGKELVEKGKEEILHKKEQVSAAYTAGKKAYVEAGKNNVKEPVGA